MEETSILNQDNLFLPEGYYLYSTKDSSIVNPTVTIKNGKPTEESYMVKVFKRNQNGNIIIENVTGFSKISSNLAEKYVLANNIDLSQYDLWTPIGWTETEDLALTGELDGNGKNITGLNCNYSSYSASNVGLFAINSGTIKNLKVTANEVYGDSNIGIITGNNASNGLIENCHISGTVKSLGSAGGGGGIAGGNTGTISNSYAILTNFVKGYAGVGGIVGWYKNATMVNTYCAGTENVYGAQYVGIDFGYNAGGTSSISGIKTYSTTNTGLTAIPSSYSGDLWDMNGQIYSSCPNLKNNPN